VNAGGGGLGGGGLGGGGLGAATQLGWPVNPFVHMPGEQAVQLNCPDSPLVE